MLPTYDSDVRRSQTLVGEMAGFLRLKEDAFILTVGRY
jgi:hypothetical protein